MKTLTKNYIGLDVSKEELVIAEPNANKWEKSKIPNTIDCISEWLEQTGVEGKEFILEATGTYSDRLIHVLHEKKAVFCVVSPMQSRAMSKVLLKSNKNDDQDAQTLSLLGEKLEIKPYKMLDNNQKKRKEAFSALVSLQKQERQLKNQLHAFEFRVAPSPIVVKSLQDVLSSVQEAILSLEKELNPDPTDEESLQIIDQITSIKGIGKATATALVTYFGNFNQFDSAKAFAKFTGLSPTEFTSGKSVRGKSSITKSGSGKIRSMLFNCARSAMRYNQSCKEIYNRLIEKGKNGKIALTAVMHKLARLVFGVVHSKVNYDPNFALLKQKSGK